MTKSKLFVQRWWLIVILYLAFWTIAGVFDASHTYLRFATAGIPMTWPRALLLGQALYHGWGALAIVILLLVRWLPLQPRGWPWRLAVHAFAAVVMATIKVAYDYPFINLLYCPNPEWLPFAQFMKIGLERQFHFYVGIYAAVVAAGHAIRYYAVYRDREAKNVQLEARLAQVELHLLQSQLNPHFLCNSLNAVAALVHHDANLVEMLLARLGTLLRQSLDAAEHEEVPLRQELEFTRAYLDIEQVRFGSRLQVEWQIDEALAGALVPYLILQPLVENAIRHGILPKPGASRLIIQGRRIGDDLELQVLDDGVGLARGNGGLRERIGLGNTRARLRQLYNGRHRLDLDNRPGGGLAVTLTMPYAEFDGTFRSPNPRAAHALAGRP